jgi:hypothetical protein
MQRLGRVAAALLQAHRSLLAAGAVQQQQQHATAAVVQCECQEVSCSFDQRDTLPTKLNVHLPLLQV